MTTHRTTGSLPRSADAQRLAAAARSILSCPDDVQLVVDGVSDISEGLEADHPGAEPVLRMREVAGHPVFSCPPSSVLAEAGSEGRSALLTLRSGLGAPGSADRLTTLTLAGTLASELEECACCDEIRARVTVRPDMVLLSRIDEPDQRLRVPLAAFNSRDLHLNRGFLQRSVEHANDCHQDDLRHAIATTAGVRVAEIAGVTLADLRPDRVDLRWVDHAGAHSRTLPFSRTAESAEELGTLLREELHAGLC